jgi:pilus assembly protein CpaF
MSVYGPLQAALDDPAVTELMVNGAGPVWIERDGALLDSGITLDAASLDVLVERLLAPSGRRVDRRTPFVDARMPDGSRVNVVIPPAAVDGPCITIRRFSSSPRSLAAFAGDPVATLLRHAMRARANVIISGASGAGKTTLLNALAGEIPAGERIVTIEDAAELRLHASHVVRLEARPPNSEGTGSITTRQLMRNALRMRPDRLVVGEVRGAESIELLHAMNTGHDGSLTTCHANGPIDALRRLETMIAASGESFTPAGVREQLIAAVDLVVHVARDASGRRRVVRVAEPITATPLSLRDLSIGDELVARPRRRPRSSTSGSSGASWLDP